MLTGVPQTKRPACPSVGGQGGALFRVGLAAQTPPAPLTVAAGFFVDQPVDVLPEHQIGRDDILDKLKCGRLHPLHAVLGMPLCSALDRDRFFNPLVAATFDPRGAFPTATHHTWLRKQTVRWGHLSEGPPSATLAGSGVPTGAFREVAGDPGVTLPMIDAPPMQLLH